METELINIIDEHGNLAGVATREEVHKQGHWHETFHCWCIDREDGVDYIYLQIRSDKKKDFPNLLDITAAGHILAHETVKDGVREVEEELGLDVSFHELVSLGVIKDCIITGDFIDKEMCHVFLYQNKGATDDFNLQEEEVSGIVKAEFNAFYEFCTGKTSNIQVEGFEVMETGQRALIDKAVSKYDFVPHENLYFQSIVELIRKNMTSTE